MICPVDFAGQNCPALHVRSYERIAERVDDVTPTSCDNCIQTVTKDQTTDGRVVVGKVELVSWKCEASPLDGDVKHR